MNTYALTYTHIETHAITPVMIMKAITIIVRIIMMEPITNDNQSNKK